MRVEAKKHGQIFNYFINQGVQIMTKDMTMGSPLRMILLFSIFLSSLIILTDSDCTAAATAALSAAGAVFFAGVRFFGAGFLAEDALTVSAFASDAFSADAGTVSEAGTAEGAFAFTLMLFVSFSSAIKALTSFP